MNTREIIAFLVMCIVWGAHFVVIKVAVGEIPPMFYAAARMTIVAIILLPFLRWRKGSMLRVFGAAACLGSLNYAFMFTGISMGSASVSAIALELYVPFATILSVLILKERIGLPRIFGISMAFMGVAIVALGDAKGGIGLGVLFIIGAAIVEAIGAILIKTIKTFKPYELLAWFGLTGAVILWAATGMFETGQWQAFEASNKTAVIAAVFYSALAASLFAHTVYYWLIQRLSVSMVAPSALLSTMFAVVFSVIFLGDPVTLTLIIGGSLTFGGVGFVLFRSALKGKPNAATGRQEPFIESPAEKDG